MIEIPLLAGASNANQSFSQRLNGFLFNFNTKFCSYTNPGYWVINIYQDGLPIGLGLPLNPGADLLGNQNIGELGRFIFVGETPTVDNLGIANKLVWIPAE